MRTKTINIYKFNELSEEAKKNALSTFRYANVDGTDWYEKTMDEFHNHIWNTMGIDIPLDSFRVDGYTMPEYASFEAYLTSVEISYILEKENFKYSSPLSHMILGEYLIGDIFRVNWRTCDKNSVDVWLRPLTVDIDKYPRICRFISHDIERATEAVRNWKNEACEILLKWLQDDYDQLISDEAVMEYLCDNDKEFLKDGKEWRE